MTAGASPLALRETAIRGLLVVDLPLHGDARGWFKEHWHRRRMVELGLPDFGPVQQNLSYNTAVGTTRASMPVAVPTKATCRPRAASASATARPG